MAANHLDKTAYCGLFCGQCAFGLGTVPDLARDLRKELRKIKFDKIMGMSKVLDKEGNPELVAYLWKLSSVMSKQFKKDWMSTKGNDEKLIEKYGKYIL